MESNLTVQLCYLAIISIPNYFWKMPYIPRHRWCSAYRHRRHPPRLRSLTRRPTPCWRLKAPPRQRQWDVSDSFYPLNSFHEKFLTVRSDFCMYAIPICGSVKLAWSKLHLSSACGSHLASAYEASATCHDRSNTSDRVPFVPLLSWTASWIQSSSGSLRRNSVCRN